MVIETELAFQFFVDRSMRPRSLTIRTTCSLLIRRGKVVAAAARPWMGNNLAAVGKAVRQILERRGRLERLLPGLGREERRSIHVVQPRADLLCRRIVLDVATTDATIREQVGLHAAAHLECGLNFSLLRMLRRPRVTHVQ